LICAADQPCSQQRKVTIGKHQSSAFVPLGINLSRRHTSAWPSA